MHRKRKEIQRKKKMLFFSVFFVWCALAFSPVVIGQDGSGAFGLTTQEVFANEHLGPSDVCPEGWIFSGGQYVCGTEGVLNNTREELDVNEEPTTAEGPGFWEKRLLTPIGNAIVSTGALLTYGGGQLLEKSIEVFVTGFGALLSNETAGGIQSSNLGAVVDEVWKIVRDVSNLIFIFGFLFIGVRLIYNADSSGAKNALARLIIAALLVNFSLFITKFVIEFFNLLSFAIYSQMTNGGTTKITTSIMNILGLSGLYSPTSPEFLAGLTGGGRFWFFIMAFVFMIMAAFVFLSGAIMMLTRFVALLFIMMFSPILFAANVFPQTAQHAKKMWKQLFDYSVFAPAYLFLLYVAIVVLGGMNLAGANNFSDVVNSLEDPAGGKSDSYMVVLNFVVAIIVIQFAASLAKRMGLAGGELAVTVANKGKRVAKTLTLGAPRALGRTAIGLTSDKFLSGYKQWEAKDPKEMGSAGKVTRSLMRGFNVDRSIKNTLDAGTKVKLGGKYSYADNVAYNEQARREVTAKTAEMKREENIKNAVREIEKDRNSVTSTQIKAMVSAIRDLTTEQLKNMEFKTLTNSDVAAHISDKQLENLEKTGKYSDAQLSEIKNARKTGLTRIAEEKDWGEKRNADKGGLSLREIILQRDAKEIAKMPTDVFAAAGMAEYIMPNMIEEKMKLGLSTDDMEKIRNNIDNGIQNETNELVRERMRKQWKNWEHYSNYGARFGLQSTRENTKEEGDDDAPRIVKPGDQGVGTPAQESERARGNNRNT